MTEEAGDTNADDVSAALRDLPVVLVKENTSSISGSCRSRSANRTRTWSSATFPALLNRSIAKEDELLEEELFVLARERIAGVFGYLGEVNPRTQFLVYSRSRFDDPAEAKKWVEDVIGHFPRLEGRLFTMSMPGDRASATFRDAATKQILRTRVKELVLR